MKTSFPENIHDIRISHPSQSGFIKRRVALLITIAALAILGFFWVSGPVYAPSSLPTPTSSLAACTQEAKLCPDGSAVGRTGPNCEFAECPGEDTYQGVYPSQEDCEQKTRQKCGYGRCDVIPLGKTVEEVCGKNFHEGWMPLTSNWKTYRNEIYGFEVRYPSNINLWEDTNSIIVALRQDAPQLNFAVTFSLSPNLSLNEFAAKSIGKNNPRDVWTQIDFHGIPAIQATQQILGPETMSAYFQYFVFVKDGIGYVITMSGTYKFTAEEQQSLESILSTFRFIK